MDLALRVYASELSRLVSANIKVKLLVGATETAPNSGHNKSVAGYCKITVGRC